MKKVTAFIGCASKKNTYRAVRQFLDNLQALGDVECEIVVLSDYQIGICRGCKVCFEKGEAKCPLKDDRDVLIEKMAKADGVIFASPNYSFHISSMMKAFLDRLGFAFHRPSFFGKAFTSIVTQGIYGGGEIVNYLDFVGNGLGFNTLKGNCFTALEPMTEKEKLKRDRVLAAQSKRFYKTLMKSAYPTPNLFKLMAFRMGRTSMKLELDDANYDYRYYQKKGWFEADYFYPARLDTVMKLFGNLFDALQTRMTLDRKSLSPMEVHTRD